MQLLPASSSLYTSLHCSKAHSNTGLVSPEKPILLSSISCCLQPKGFESSLWVSRNNSIYSSFTSKAASVEAGTISSGTAKNEVLKALIIDPDFGTDIVTCGFVKDLQINEALGEVSFRLELTTPACPIKDIVNDTVIIV